MDPIPHAKANLSERHKICIGEKMYEIVIMIAQKDQTPFESRWWKGKEASIIAVDVCGNFFLRYCDGSVLFWHQKDKSMQVIAQSVNKFLSMLQST